MIAALPLAATAQTATPQAETITVTSMGLATGPVSGGVVEAVVMGRDLTADGLEDVLRKAGVDNFITDQSIFGRLPSTVGLRGVMPGISPTDVDAVNAAVKNYVNAHKNAVVVRVAFFGLAVDCPPIEAKAREQSLQHAQTQAQQLARAAGSTLGSVTSVAEKEGCHPPGRLGGSYAIDPQTLQMTVPVEETVTYSTRATN